MSCEQYGNLTICRTSTESVRRFVRRCPWCQVRRRIVCEVPDSPYYSPTFTCCACGDSWSDGFVLPRPFSPGWRKKASSRAKRLWKAAA